MTDPNASNTGQGAPPPPPPPPGAPVPAGQPAPAPGLVSAESNDAKTMAMLCHLLAIFTAWLVPLILWLVKKDESPFVNQQGKEVLNFELTLMIGVVVGFLTICIYVGIIILLAVSVVNIVFGILSTIEVNKGKPYRYPFAIRFIK